MRNFQEFGNFAMTTSTHGVGLGDLIKIDHEDEGDEYAFKQVINSVSGRCSLR